MYHEENFEEAIRSVNFAYNQTLLPENIQCILKDEKLLNLTSNVGKINFKNPQLKLIVNLI